MAIKKLYTAHVTSTGGRGQGRAKSADGMLDIKIGQPKEMGGTDDGLNPDQLFAAAYSTCLLGTIKYVSAKEKKTVRSEEHTSELQSHSKSRMPSSA